MPADSIAAVAVVSPTEGSEVAGVVHFMETSNGVEVSGTIANLSPGKHGFHIHEAGDCTDPAGKSAGGHFNPDGSPHGGRLDANRHIGDLGNIEAGADGRAEFTIIDTVLTLHGDNSIIGRALIVHGGEDDLVSQPSGDAGPRVACGVVGHAKAPKSGESYSKR
jgi:Cu-Zn family superoxide dismutase